MIFKMFIICMNSVRILSQNKIITQSTDTSSAGSYQGIMMAPEM